mmetsp:Transcript_58715/g.163850  ORF Transcript_58715/g.163850 Transcript_58715/m.163850 type:complete len:367 (+) Transcript_58715:354-1454(+)
MVPATVAGVRPQRSRRPGVDCLDPAAQLPLQPPSPPTVGAPETGFSPDATPMMPSRNAMMGSKRLPSTDASNWPSGLSWTIAFESPNLYSPRPPRSRTTLKLKLRMLRASISFCSIWTLSPLPPAHSWRITGASAAFASPEGFGGDLRPRAAAVATELEPWNTSIPGPVEALPRSFAGEPLRRGGEVVPPRTDEEQPVALRGRAGEEPTRRTDVVPLVALTPRGAAGECPFVRTDTAFVVASPDNATAAIAMARTPATAASVALAERRTKHLRTKGEATAGGGGGDETVTATSRSPKTFSSCLTTDGTGQGPVVPSQLDGVPFVASKPSPAATGKRTRRTLQRGEPDGLPGALCAPPPRTLAGLRT